MTGKSLMQENIADQVDSWPVDLDITAETCPMTFVRVRLMLDRLPPGAVAVVRLAGAEPLENVPRTLQAQGHAVLGLGAETGGAASRLRLRKKA
jgi:TusA-related sulfurtransferase